MTERKETNPKAAIGIKKAGMSCVPACVLAEVGVAMMDGAAKYGSFNFRESGVRTSVYYDATMRHLLAFWEGEDCDPDSGLSHVTKAITSLVVLRDAMIQGKCTDDRPPKSVPFYAELNAKAAGVVEKYAGEKTVDDDGWIAWGGGECPVSSEETVEVRLRDFIHTSRDHAHAYYWSHKRGTGDRGTGDIIAYRIVD